jgi:hypothetical protein
LVVEGADHVLRLVGTELADGVDTRVRTGD